MTPSLETHIITDMENVFTGIRAVLFDLDGTLVETSIDFTLMKREMLHLGERYGVPGSDLAGLDILAIVEAVYALLVSRPRASDAETMRGEAYGILQRIELASCGQVDPIAGALELLYAVRNAGMKICIVTRNCRPAVELSLARTGVFYDALLTRDDVPKTKPHPDHLISALSPLGICPHEALMVGDHWMDVVAGRAAGTRTVGFLRSDRPDSFFDEHAPDLVIRSLSELTSALAEIECFYR